MTNASLMRYAWRLARQGQERFGGKVSEYLGEAMKIAWANKKKLDQQEENTKVRGVMESVQNNEILNLVQSFAKDSGNNPKFNKDEFMNIINKWVYDQDKVMKSEANRIIN